MKHLTLRDVMARMSITVNGDGFEVTNPAGTAQYDAWGSRTTVNGVPEYFPLQLSVSGMASFETTAPHGGGYSASIQVEADTSELEKKLDEINNLIKNSTAFELINGQAFIKPATISRDKITVNTFSLYAGADSNVSEIIKNAIANQKDTEQIEKRIQNATREAIEKALRPSGAIYRAIKG
ncbi:hypothetical protein [Hafnia alvei]|uniref:hypothetical protein n=1 Tax=Hafnia alvei TaxID=569 RepID=UPI00103358E6|nr:hypothetical protein [Hafnia alvei]TBM25085.1 hypothetical protein EYY91_18125 [Hafnia alvei]